MRHRHFGGKDAEEVVDRRQVGLLARPPGTYAAGRRAHFLSNGLVLVISSTRRPGRRAAEYLRR